MPLPISQPINPPGNIAFNPSNLPFPKASASYADRFGGKPSSAIDGKTNFLPSPTNRWTSYESPNSSDWLEVDFGADKSFNKIELAIYDDRGGVQPPLITMFNSGMVQNGKKCSLPKSFLKNP